MTLMNGILSKSYFHKKVDEALEAETNLESQIEELFK